MAWIQEYAEI